MNIGGKGVPSRQPASTKALGWERSWSVHGV